MGPGRARGSGCAGRGAPVRRRQESVESTLQPAANRVHCTWRQATRPLPLHFKVAREPPEQLIIKPFIKTRPASKWLLPSAPLPFAKTHQAAGKHPGMRCTPFSERCYRQRPPDKTRDPFQGGCTRESRGPVPAFPLLRLPDSKPNSTLRSGWCPLAPHLHLPSPCGKKARKEVSSWRRVRGATARLTVCRGEGARRLQGGPEPRQRRATC